jgi:hypothetical protein
VKRYTQLVAFSVAALTVAALALALMIRLGAAPEWHRSSLRGEGLLEGLLWVGAGGGLACATIVAAKTAKAVFGGLLARRPFA